MGAWPVELTDELEAWWSSEEVSEDDQEAITAAVELLQERGPALGRPLVDGVKSSRHPNMKELRPQRNDIRIFFAFDPRRAAILLIGGSKTGQWTSFYQRSVPVADALYDQHLAELRAEGLIP
jgi:hypothetical protein